MNILLYLLQVTACTAVFYLFYFLLLSRLTFFTTNRWYLLTTVILSFTIPLLRITLTESHPYVEAVQQVMYQKTAIQPDAMTSVVIHEPVTNGLQWDVVLQACYYTIVAGLSMHLLATLLVFFKRIKAKRIISIGKVRVLSGQQKVTNGSFLNYIFLNDDELSPEEMQQIIAHELLHVKLWHSADRILIKLAQIALWFNPFIYLYARSVEENHEFEVDREIARSTDKQNYANLLLHLSVAKQGILYHSFSKIPLKKRISMLFTKPSNKMKRVIYVLIVPVVLISCLAFAKLKKSNGFNNQVIRDTAVVYRQKIKRTPEQARLYKKQQEEFNKYRQTDDYKNKMTLANDISGKTIDVTVKGTVANKAYPGKQVVIMAMYKGHEYGIDSRYGQEKALVNRVKPGDLLSMKVFSWVVRQGYPVMITPAYVIKNKIKIFQLAEADKLPDHPFLYEANKVRFAEGQISNIVKYPNGKWKSALFETVNGYRFSLNFKLSAPDLNSIEDGDHVRLRFVHEVKTGAKTYHINDWVSITTNIKDYGIKNPELFNRFYVAEKAPDNTSINKNAASISQQISSTQQKFNAISKGGISNQQKQVLAELKDENRNTKWQTYGEYNKNVEKSNLPGTDTVEFAVKKYNMPEGALLSRLLSVLPNVNVGDDGSVSYQGDAVTRFTINNQAYKEGDIKYAVQHLSAANIALVQVSYTSAKGSVKTLNVVIKNDQTYGAKKPENQSKIDKEVMFVTNCDSSAYDPRNGLRYLYGAHITYGDFELNADFIRVDEKNHLMFASGRMNPITKKYTGKPVYKAGKNQSVISDSLQISYNDGKSSVKGKAFGSNSATK